MFPGDSDCRQDGTVLMGRQGSVLKSLGRETSVQIIPRSY